MEKTRGGQHFSFFKKKIIRMKPTQGENRGRVLVGREERHRERDREGEGGMEECKEDERDRQTD